MADARCRHPGCHCDARHEHDGYCGEVCASLGSTRSPSGACPCGHPECIPVSRARAEP